MSTDTISPSIIRRLIEAHQPMRLIDVRTPMEFAQLHATGAESFPLDDLDPAAIAASQKDAPGPLYVLCQSGARAAKACDRLKQAGLNPVLSIEGGTIAWQRAGLPVDRGQSRTISLERQVRIAAGSLVFIGSILAWTVHPLFVILPTFVGAGLVFAGITDTCGMGMMLAKMPWNRIAPDCHS